MRTTKKKTKQLDIDSWTFDERSSPTAVGDDDIDTPRVPPRSSASPVGAGYEGQRGIVNKFMQTEVLQRADAGESALLPLEKELDEKKTEPSIEVNVTHKSEPGQGASASHPGMAEDPAKQFSDSHTIPRVTETRLVRLGTVKKDLLVASLILILNWFLPDAWTTAPIFPIHSLWTSDSLFQTFGFLFPPLAGAVILTLVYLPLPAMAVLVVSMFLGLGALCVPLLSLPFVLPVSGGAVLLAMLIASLSSIIGFTVLDSKKIGYFALMVIPAVLIVVAVFGAFETSYSLAHFAVLKAPIELFASTSIIAISCSSLLLQMYSEKRFQDGSV